MQEQDTLELVDLVVANAGPDDIVLSDYASINFHAQRPSVYEASIIAHGRITSGIVTGKLLIESMAEKPAALILLHVPGGTQEPEHFFYLKDFDTFMAYVTANYERIQTFDRHGQLIEVYSRRPD